MEWLGEWRVAPKGHPHRNRLAFGLRLSRWASQRGYGETELSTPDGVLAAGRADLELTPQPPLNLDRYFDAWADTRQAVA